MKNNSVSKIAHPFADPKHGSHSYAYTNNNAWLPDGTRAHPR